MCLNEINAGSKVFAKYQSSGRAQLAGIINCAGCPTLVAPDKLLNRIRVLTELGIDVLHFSTCILALCPYQKKYQQLIESNFPNVKIELGTHDGGGEAGIEMFKQGVHNLLCQPAKTMADMVKQRMSQEAARTFHRTYSPSGVSELIPELCSSVFALSP